MTETTCAVTLLTAVSLFVVSSLSVSIGSPVSLSIANLSITRAMAVRMASCVERELDAYELAQCSKNTCWYFSENILFFLQLKVEKRLAILSDI